jgi:hypothetical protein
VSWEARFAAASVARTAPRTVLDNLLANTRDHTDPGSMATVRLADGDGTARLTVADNGPGMSPDEAAHAFERLWQAEPTPFPPPPRHRARLGHRRRARRRPPRHDQPHTSLGAGTTLTITLPTANDRLAR